MKIPAPRKKAASRAQRPATAALAASERFQIAPMWLWREPSRGDWLQLPRVTDGSRREWWNAGTSVALRPGNRACAQLMTPAGVILPPNLFLRFGVQFRCKLPRTWLSDSSLTPMPLVFRGLHGVSAARVPSASV
eukprot:scaffold1849_cov239-Pinguiococcus_pyrenoidosus.AAC.7